MQRFIVPDSQIKNTHCIHKPCFLSLNADILAKKEFLCIHRHPEKLTNMRVE